MLVDKITFLTIFSLNIMVNDKFSWFIFTLAFNLCLCNINFKFGNYVILWRQASAADLLIFTFIMIFFVFLLVILSKKNYWNF